MASNLCGHGIGVSSFTPSRGSGVPDFAAASIAGRSVAKFAITRLMPTGGHSAGSTPQSAADVDDAVAGDDPDFTTVITSDFHRTSPFPEAFAIPAFVHQYSHARFDDSAVESNFESASISPGESSIASSPIASAVESMRAFFGR